MSQEFTAEQMEIMPRIEKLLRMAGRSPNEAEAFLAKAQEYMDEYNLDMAAIEQNTGDTGKRLDEKLKGGHFKYQRDLWESVAELNFCMYWNLTEQEKAWRWEKREDNSGFYKRHFWKAVKRHRLVGRLVNVKSSMVMAQYLEQTVERLTRERLAETLLDAAKGRSQLYSEWANSFREGMVERICEKLYARRQQILSEERAANEAKAKAARDAGFADVSTGGAITLASLKDSEKQANYDFLHGEGAWARKEAQKLANQREHAEWLARREARDAQWLAENPEEAARQAEEKRKREKRLAARREKYWQTTGQYSYRAPGKSYKGDWSARRDGYAVGDTVSIDLQAGGTKVSGALK